MEFKVTKENFIEGLSATQGVVEKKNTMPVLSNILLEADKTGLKITATDLEVALVYQIPAQVILPGKLTVSAKSLYDIIKEIGEMEVFLKLEANNRLHVQAGTSQFNIPGLEAKEFPSLPTVETSSNNYSCQNLLGMIEKTQSSISMDETRHHLAGLLFQKSKDKGLRMVATDGHRLSLIEKEIMADGEYKVIVPKKGVMELKKMVLKGESIELAVGQKNLFARQGNQTLYIRLIDGEFPDYDRVIPKESDKFATLPREKLIGALRRVSLLSNERSRAVLLSLSPKNLEVSIHNPDLGEAREELEIDYKGESLKIGFNARYFLDVLNVLKDEKIILGLKNESAPCIVKAETEPGYLGVIMPMRV